VRGGNIEYVVRRGDSLWRIANRFATTTKAIQVLNNLTTTHLFIGQVLLIPQEVNDSTTLKTSSTEVPNGKSAVMTARKEEKESVSTREAH
jgi:LysM repeat protein